MQRTNMYLDERQLRTLKHLAAENRESVAAIVRRAVDAYIDQPLANDIVADATATHQEIRRMRRVHPAATITMPSRREIAEFCHRHDIRWLAVYGSVLRDDFGPESDVDVLVEFEDGKTPGLAFIDIQDELSTLFDGRTVDLGTRRALNRWVRDRVLSEARVLYDAA